MNMQKCTQKSLEALQNAQSIAIEYSNQQLDQEHLLAALCALPAFKGRIFLNAGEKPYISLRLRSGEKPLDAARAFLSDRYRRIDNYEIAEAVLPIIADIKDARIESCEVTDERMYIKVVNPRLETEVVPGDVVQSGIIITNMTILIFIMVSIAATPLALSRAPG